MQACDIDLGLYTTKTLAQTNPNHPVEVRTQLEQNSDENWAPNLDKEVSGNFDFDLSPKTKIVDSDLCITFVASENLQPFFSCCFSYLYVKKNKVFQIRSFVLLSIGSDHFLHKHHSSKKLQIL